MNKEQFSALVAEYGIDYETVIDSPSFEDQSYYGESCWGTETITVVNTPTEVVVGNLYRSSKGEETFTVSVTPI